LVKIISVISGKGGVGKTTCVINLATILATRFNKKVGIVDCNVTSSHLGLHIGLYGVPTTLNNILRKEAKIEEALYTYLPNLQILPASLSLNDLEGTDIRNLEKFLRKSFENYDYVFLDAAAGFGKEALSAIMASDEVLFITTPDIPSVTDIVRGKDLTEKLKIKTLGVVLNRVRGKKFELKNPEITHLTGLPILESIPEDEKVLESLGLKLPVVNYKPNSKVSVSYLKLASSIAGETYQPNKTGIIQKFISLFGRR